MKRVGFGPRLLALIIDAVIIFIVVGIIGALSGSGKNIDPQEFSSIFSDPSRFMNPVQIIIVLLYTSMEFLLAATPGKMISKMKMKGASGIHAALPVLLTRWVIKQSANILSFVFIITHIQFIWVLQSLAGLVIFIGCFFALGKNKQALHDRLAKTGVYK